MYTKTIDKILNDDGETYTPAIPPNSQYTTLLRLVADEGKAVTNGTIVAGVIDIETDDLPNWSEVDAPIDEQIFENELLAEALEDING